MPRFASRCSDLIGPAGTGSLPAARTRSKVFDETVDTTKTPVVISVPMTQRTATSPIAQTALAVRADVRLPVALLLVVVVLITSSTGAGIGFV